jgi:hypothetical protein
MKSFYLTLFSTVGLVLGQGPISFQDLIPYTNAFIANRTFPGTQLAVVKASGEILFQ